MAKRRLYIHVGPHKTGTTSIQRGLVANREALKALGYHYPEVGFIYDGHHNLVFEINEMDKYVPILGGLKQLVEFGKTSSGHIILSSETFDNIVTPAPLEKLKNALSDFEIHIIGYLRPQDELLQSLWKTEVRFEGLFDDFDTWLPKALERWPFLKYDEWISVFVDVFGNDNVHFQIYDPKTDDLFLQFLRLCQIKDLSTIKVPERENVSLPNLTFELVRRFYINPYIERRQDKDGKTPIQKSSYANVAKIVKKFMDAEGLEVPFSCYTQAMLKDVRDRFRPHNQKAAKAYFGRPRLFLSEKRLKPAPRRLIDLLTREQTLRLGAQMIAMEQDRARKIRARKERERQEAGNTNG